MKNMFIHIPGIDRLTQIDKETDFVFIFRNKLIIEEFPVSKRIACFISPNVFRLYLADAAVDAFEITEEITNPLFFMDQIMSNEIIKISNENYKNYFLLFKSLGNEHYANQIVDAYENDNEISLGNVIEKILFKSIRNVFDIDDEVNFLASHFCEINQKEFERIDISILEKVLINDNLLVWNEDSLLQLILELGNDYLSLLYLIEFAFISTDAMMDFIQLINLFDINSFTWNKICSRLLVPIDLKKIDNIPKRKHRYKKSVDFIEKEILPSDDIFDGILNFLGKDDVLITSSGNERNNVSMVKTRNWNDFWLSNNKPNSFIKFDFLHRKVVLKQYSLRSGGYSGFFMESWVVEGSNDGEVWTLFDQKTSSTLGGSFFAHKFICDCEEKYRYIRIRQIGINSGGTHMMMLNNVELFGEIYIKKK